MSQVRVRYDYGFNNAKTNQHEVIEYVMRSSRVTCRCFSPQHFHGSGLESVEEGPYVVLFTEKRATAEAIAMLLNADGNDQNFPDTPLAQATMYMKQRFAKAAASSPPPRENDPQLGRDTWKTDYSMAPGDCPPGDLGNEVR